MSSAVPRRVIGLCGGIGSGKSSRMKHLAKWWDAEGKQVFPAIDVVHSDADLVAHRCYTPGTDTYHKVVSHFGDEILSSDNTASGGGDDKTVLVPPEIDRKKLGKLVFGTGRMGELNNIVWPALADAVQSDIVLQQGEIASQKQGQQGGRRALVYLVEAAILPHMPQMLHMCDEVWLFHANEEAAMHRIMERNNVTAEEALRRIRSQSTVDEKRALVNKSGRMLQFFDTTTAESPEAFQESLDTVVEYFKTMVQTSPTLKVTAENATAKAAQ